MTDNETKDAAHPGDHKGTNEAKHDKHSDDSGKHKEKGSGPSDTLAPADDDIIIK